MSAGLLYESSEKILSGLGYVVGLAMGSDLGSNVIARRCLTDIPGGTKIKMYLQLRNGA